MVEKNMAFVTIPIFFFTISTYRNMWLRMHLFGPSTVTCSSLLVCMYATGWNHVRDSLKPKLKINGRKKLAIALRGWNQFGLAKKTCTETRSNRFLRAERSVFINLSPFAFTLGSWKDFRFRKFLFLKWANDIFVDGSRDTLFHRYRRKCHIIDTSKTCFLCSWNMT